MSAASHTIPPDLHGRRILVSAYDLEQGEHRGIAVVTKALIRCLHDAGAEVSVINAGVSGDTTAGGLSRIEWTLTPGVDAIIVALGGNDLLRGVDPASSRSNLEGILQIATEQGLDVLLVGMEAPSNFGSDF